MLRSLRDPKARSEYPKELPVWMELDYFGRRRGLRSWRAGLSWGVAVLGVAAVVLLLAGTRDRRAFQAAPVSRVHRPFNDDCQACHVQRFETARRLLPQAAAAHSVPDAACRQCHPGSVHHTRAVGESACVACHREHRGEELLAQLDARTCTSCHADLKDHTDSAKPADLDRPVRDVSAFTAKGHPEFALWASGTKDPGTVRFNHRKHLNPGGIPVGGERRRTVLACDRCHQLDAAGRYMAPIDYERHCQECHPLKAGLTGRFADESLQRAFAAFVDAPLRHPRRGETAEIVRAELRERYTRFGREHPKALEGGQSERPARPIPGVHRPDDDAEAEKLWTWVTTQLHTAERPLFDSQAGCAYCHTETTKASERPDGLPAYALPAIKSRWLPHSIFSHERHRALDCEQCHPGVRQSEQTAAVLMPRIESCHTCHKPGGAAARAHCNECHLYHNPDAERSWTGDLTIPEFFKGRPAARSK